MIKKFLCIIFISVLLTSCQGVFPYASENEDVYWYSDSPKIEFYYAEDEIGYRGHGHIIVNDESIEIICYWDAHYGYNLEILDASSFDINRDSREFRLIYGTYRMKGETVILTVEEDNVFGGKYDTITFYMKNVEK